MKNIHDIILDKENFGGLLSKGKGSVIRIFKPLEDLDTNFNDTMFIHISNIDKDHELISYLFDKKSPIYKNRTTVIYGEEKGILDIHSPLRNRLIYITLE